MLIYGLDYERVKIRDLLYYILFILLNICCYYIFFYKGVGIY